MLHKLDKPACHTRLSWTNLFKNKLVSIVTVMTFVSYEIPSVYWFLGLWFTLIFVCGFVVYVVFQCWFLGLCVCLLPFVGLWCMLISICGFVMYVVFWCWFLGLWCMLIYGFDCWCMSISGFSILVGVCWFLDFGWCMLIIVWSKFWIWFVWLVLERQRKEKKIRIDLLKTWKKL